VKFKPAQLARDGDEESHQVALMCWAADNVVKYPALRWLFAIPNGGKRDRITAARLKAQGVKAGVGDLFLMCARRGFHGLFIEMKAGDNTLAEDQITFGADAVLCGYRYEVCYTWEQAVAVLQQYLDD
jgi:hypothetical protein